MTNRGDIEIAKAKVYAPHESLTISGFFERCVSLFFRTTLVTRLCMLRCSMFSDLLKAVNPAKRCRLIRQSFPECCRILAKFKRISNLGSTFCKKIRLEYSARNSRFPAKKATARSPALASSPCDGSPFRAFGREAGGEHLYRRGEG